MLAFLVCCVVLAISATYELIEWWRRWAMVKEADDFLGTQGGISMYTQSDMLAPWGAQPP